MHGYDNDFFLWAQEQAELLRTGKLAEVDRSNLADEMDSLVASNANRARDFPGFSNIFCNGST